MLKVRCATGLVWLMCGLALAACSDPSVGSGIETSVHRSDRDMMETERGNVNFSELHNSPELSAPEREYLDRLYEIFFAVPLHLKSEFESTGEIPSLEAMSRHFAVGEDAVDLLLTAMESDSRMPDLFTRNTETGEVETLDVQGIDRFVRKRGSQVKVSGWRGKPFPDFEATTLEGETIRRDDLLGRKAMLFFWLTRCPVCQRITPNIVEIHRRYHSEDFQILGFNVDASMGLNVPDQERSSFIAERGVEYPNCELDPQTRKDFGNMNIFPAMFLLDEHGVVSEFLINYQDIETLDRLVRAQLDTPSTEGGS